MKKIITLTMASALFMPQLFLHADESHRPKEQMMCEHMQKMMSQMEEIRKTDNPARRDKLMQEHMQTMREGMAMHQGGEKMGCANQEMQPGQAEKSNKKHDHRKSK